MPFQNMPFTGGNFEFKVIKRAYTKQKATKVQGILLPLSIRKDKSGLVLGSANIHWSSIIYHGVGTGQENPQHMRMCIKYPPKMHNTYA